MTDRTDQVAIVTGGSQGIGLATVAALAGRGMLVVAVARNRSRLEDAIAALPPDARGRVKALAADISQHEAVARLIASSLAEAGRIDVLINCAGVSMSARTQLGDSDPSEWHRLIDINLTGTYLMCRAALPHLLQSPGGYILNVQSTAAFASQPGVALYAASKFGVRALTEGLIEEHRNASLRISSVSPGPVDTSIWSHKIQPPDTAQRALMLRPGDIAEIILWLLDRPHHLHIPNITVTPWTGI